jgi:hypothetical protein
MKVVTEVFILSREMTPRLNYVAGFLSDATGIRFTVINTTNDAPYLINYSQSLSGSAFNIPASGFIAENGIRSFEPEIKLNGGNFLFPASGYDIPFDIFSAIFYLLSRYEEYLPFVPDQYGRFEVQQSYSFRHNFHQEPVIDQWLQDFKIALVNKFPGLIFTDSRYTFISTIDIDSPWAYLHRGPCGNLPGLLKSIFTGNFNDALYRLHVLAGKESDPFDVFSVLRNTEEQFGFCSTIFFLLAHKGKFDLNHSLKSDHFIRLVRDLSANHPIGIHPSFGSFTNYKILGKEIKMYCDLAGEPPVRSRQHFLLLNFPGTYRRLISMGIADDYTLGYASLPAFRAGTTLPFRFYDLEYEKQSELLIHPFLVMDVTLQQYMQLSTDEAILLISTLNKKIKAVNGNFTSLWHNESLSEQGRWKGWRRVFTEMVRMAVN